MEGDCLLPLLLRRRQLRRKGKKEHVWVKDWIQNGDSYGVYRHLLYTRTGINFVCMSASRITEKSGSINNSQGHSHA